MLGVLSGILRCPNRVTNIQKWVNVINMQDGNCTAEVKLSEEHLNELGGMHGGFSSSLVDYISCLALPSHIFDRCVSINIHMTYLKGAKLGDEITVDAKTIRIGSKIAFLEVLLKHKPTGELLVKGDQTVYILPNNQKLFKHAS